MQKNKNYEAFQLFQIFNIVWSSLGTRDIISTNNFLDLNLYKILCWFEKETENPKTVRLSSLNMG